MTLISIMLLKFQSTDKINQFQLRHHFEENENMKLPIFWLCFPRRGLQPSIQAASEA